jgi:predicted ATP-grasp superfamily ATP-dependent carboligase
MRVLILDSGNTAAYHAMRSMARAGHEVHLCGSASLMWSRSRYIASAIESPPSHDQDAYARFLVDHVRARSYDLMLFCGDHEAEAVYGCRNQINGWVACPLPDAEFDEVALRKNAALEHARSVGIDVPRGGVPASEDDVVVLARQLRFPLVVKGDRGSASSRVRYAHTLSELLAAYREIAEIERAEGARPSIQEFVSGPGYVVHCLFHRGEPMAICSHRKEREYPVAGGVTSCAVTVDHPELDRAALRLLASLRWNGLAKLDFKLDVRERRFHFLELDPRISASIDVCRAAGVDQIQRSCELAAGTRAIPQLEYRAGVRYRWLFPRDVLSVLGRPKQLPAFMLDFLRRDVHCDVGLDDPRITAVALRRLATYVRRDLRRNRIAG